MNVLNRLVVKCHKRLMDKHRVRTIYVGPEDALVLLPADTNKPQVIEAQVSTPQGLLNTVLAYGLHRCIADHSGLTNMRDASQDIAAHYGPEISQIVDGIWTNLSTGLDEGDGGYGFGRGKNPSPSPVKSPDLVTV